jgi:hypothetical protein
MKSIKKASLFFLLCLVISVSGIFGFRSYKKARYTQKKYLIRETNCSLLDEKKFLAKLEQPPPAWMEEQIEEDFQDFSNGISQERVDETFIQLKKNYPSPLFVRYRILNNQLYRYYPEGELISLSDNGTERALKALLHFKRFKDLDFILTYEDGIPFPHMPDKFFHTASKDLQAPILACAKIKKTPYVVLIPDWRSIADWWNKDVKAILEKMPKKTWREKQPYAVWRGGLTKNIRIKLCEISTQSPDYLDAKLVEDPARHESIKHLIGNRFNFEDFLNYKYLPNVTGTMASSPALQWRLLSNSVTLQQETDEIQWFYRALKPYVHYVPVKHDLSDLIEKIEWSQSHDDLCKQIADNSTEFVLNNLMTEDIYLYFYLVLNRYSSLQNLSKDLEQETLKDPRWAKIQSRKTQRKKAKAEDMKGYNSSFTPF